MASLVFHNKVLLPSGIIVEAKIWRIRDLKRYPQGYKYSLFGVYNGEVVVGYDNHYPKGPHYHIGPQEYRYKFSTVEKLKYDFKKSLQQQIKNKGWV